MPRIFLEYSANPHTAADCGARVAGIAPAFYFKHPAGSLV